MHLYLMEPHIFSDDMSKQGHPSRSNLRSSVKVKGKTYSLKWRILEVLTKVTLDLGYIYITAMFKKLNSCQGQGHHSKSKVKFINTSDCVSVKHFFFKYCYFSCFSDVMCKCWPSLHFLLLALIQHTTVDSR